MTLHRTKTPLHVLVALGLTAPALLEAQAPLRPFATEVETSVSYTAKADLEDVAGTPGIETTRYGVSTWTGLPSGLDGVSLALGVVHDAARFSGDSVAALPETLTQTALQVRAGYRATEQLLLTVSAAPGSYTDGGSLSDGFASPLTAFGIYTVNPSLSVSAGLRWSQFSDTPFLPIAGVRWVPAEDWTVSVGLPRTGVTYAVTEATEVFLAAGLEGGAYKVSDRDVSAAVRGSLVDHRQIRVTVGAAHKLGGAWALEAEVGVVVDEQWDYHERDLELETETGALVARLSLAGRF